MAVFTGNGSQTAPSFTFSSDTNTGIYRSAADTLGFVTGGTVHVQITSVGSFVVGANNLIFDKSTNRLGINTVTPARNLHISEPSANTPAYIRMTGSNRGGIIEAYAGVNPVSTYETDQLGDIYISSSLGFANPSTTVIAGFQGGNFMVGGTLPSSPNTTISASGGITTLGGINSYKSSSGYVAGATVSTTVAAAESIQYVLFSTRHTGTTTVSIEYGVLSFGTNAGVYQYTALVDDPNQAVTVSYGGAGTATVTVTGDAAPTANVLNPTFQRIR